MKILGLVFMAVLGWLWASGAQAQSGWSGVPLTPQCPNCFPQTPATASPADLVNVIVPTNGTSGFTQLGNFASQQDLSNALAQMNNTAAQINATIAADRSRAAQGIAMASSMTILPPNPGDRFSLSFSGSGYDGEGAGSVTFGYRAADRIMVFAGYARSSSQNLVKAGVAFSFQ